MKHFLVEGPLEIVAVLREVLVAIALSDLVGFTWWSLGLTIVAALVLGYLLHLGGHGPGGPDQRHPDPVGGRWPGRSACRPSGPA
ncbi:MAG: hypothetical protein ACRDRJ_13705 [Streptosporangiaceae bacterium]